METSSVSATSGVPATIARSASRSSGETSCGAERLTRREQEVLRLIAEGKTDAQIAEALYVARTTASNHVASILGKLGVPNRTAAATRLGQPSAAGR